MRTLSTTSPTALLQSLIQIPSINPEGISTEELQTGKYGELELAQAVGAFLTDCGFAVTLEEVRPGRPNVIARAPGPADRPRIALAPHLDTVGVSTMTIPPFDAAIHDGKVWGRGASDTKGTMAAMLWGLRENAATLAEAPVAIDFIAFMGEETAQLGAKHFAQHHGQHYAFAIAGEPTSLQIVNCTKGCLWATLSASGVAVHASQPHRGDNAILKLVSAFQAITTTLDQHFSATDHPILGQTTWNLGTITGGMSPNIVADYAELQIDIRTIPALWQQGGAHPLIADLCAQHGLTATIRDENPPMEVSPQNPWIRTIQSVHPDSHCVGAPWFSDAAHLNAGGIPSICLGPGDIAQAHTKDEFISIADLDAGAQYFTDLIASGLSLIHI